MSGFEFGFDTLPARTPQPAPVPPAIREGGGEGEGVEGGEGLSGFAKALADSVGEVQSLQSDVADKYESLAKGEPVSLHEIYMASGKADVAFTLMLEVRNKLVDAWQQIQRAAV